MKLQFFGAAKMVTGSCYLLETGGTKVLIDCGLYQGGKDIKERNYQKFLFKPGELNYVLLTHAHTDHSGLVPKLFKEGYKGSVLATQATLDLCRIMLPDSGHIQEMEVERKNRRRARAGEPPLSPIYTVEEAVGCIKHFKGYDYNQEISLTDNLRIRFQDAGHILGSAIIEVWVKEGDIEQKLVFSGDIGNQNQPYIQDPACLNEAGYVIMESTYGNRLHDDTQDKLTKLKEIVNATFQRGGNLIIPAFAVERTQDILYYLNLLFDQKEIPAAQIYIDSPLAISATEVFRQSVKYFDRETKELIGSGDNPLNMSEIHFSRSAQDSMALNGLKGHNIIIAASGMADAGRIKHHLKHNLWRPECTVLFVGYQAEGTLGRRLVNGEKKVTIHGEEVAVKAHIHSLDGFSAHADQQGLLNWVQCFKQSLKGIVLVHGEEEAQLELAGKLQEITGLEPLIPSLGETFEWTLEGITRIPGEAGIWQVQKPVEAGMEREANETGGPGPQEYAPREHGRREHGSQGQNTRERVTQGQVDKALLSLRSKLNQLVDLSRKDNDLPAALTSIKEISAWVDIKLSLRKGK